MISPSANSKRQSQSRSSRTQRSTLTPTRSSRFKRSTSNPYFAPAMFNSTISNNNSNNNNNNNNNTSTTTSAASIHIQELQNLMDLETDRKRSVAVQNTQLARENSLLKMKINDLESRINELLKCNFKVESKFNMCKVHYKRRLGEHIDMLERELLEKLESIIKTLDKVRERESLPRTFGFKETNLQLRRRMLSLAGSIEEENDEDGPCKKRRRRKSCSARRQSMLFISDPADCDPFSQDNGGCGGGGDCKEIVNDNNNGKQAVQEVPDGSDNLLAGTNTSSATRTVLVGNTINDYKTDSTPLAEEVRCNKEGNEDHIDDNNNTNKFTDSIIDFPIPEELGERKDQREKSVITSYNLETTNKARTTIDTLNNTAAQVETQHKLNLPPPMEPLSNISNNTRYDNKKGSKKDQKPKVEIFKDNESMVTDNSVATEPSIFPSPSTKDTQQAAVETQPPVVRKKKKSMMTNEASPTTKSERPRRTRGKVVDYTLPSLRVKMRRPSEKLVDATTFVDIHDLQVSSVRNSTSHSHSVSIKSSRESSSSSSPSPTLQSKSFVGPIESGTPALTFKEGNESLKEVIPQNQDMKDKPQSESKLKGKEKSKVKRTRVKVKVKTESKVNPLSDITNVSKSGKMDKKIRQRRKLFKNAIINDFLDENLGDYIPLSLPSSSSSSSSSSLLLTPNSFDTSGNDAANSINNNNNSSNSNTRNSDNDSSGLISQVSSFRLNEDDLAIFDTAVAHREVH